MELSGEYTIAAPRERVWEALNDAAMLKRCIPGCESLDQVSPTELAATVQAKVGPVKARFSGSVTLSDLDPPNGYRISGEGKGGAAGFAKGGAVVRLADADGGTLLSYTAEALVGGKLAQIGQRLIGGTAKKLADDFFGNLAEALGGAPVPAASAPPTVAEPPKPEPRAETSAPARPAAPPPRPAAEVPRQDEAAPAGESGSVDREGEQEMFDAAMKAASLGHARPQAPRGAEAARAREPEPRTGMSTLSKVALLIVIVLALYGLYLLID